MHAGDAEFKFPVSKSSLKFLWFMNMCSPLARVKVLLCPRSSGRTCIHGELILPSIHTQVTDLVAWGRKAFSYSNTPAQNMLMHSWNDNNIHVDPIHALR